MVIDGKVGEVDEREGRFLGIFVWLYHQEKRRWVSSSRRMFVFGEQISLFYDTHLKRILASSAVCRSRCDKERVFSKACAQGMCKHRLGMMC